MDNIIFYKYFFKDILIDLNINYLHIEDMNDNEIVKYSNIFNVLHYYNSFKYKPIILDNIFTNPSDIVEFLIELSHRYNNTQQALLIIYSYILTYYITKDNYNLNYYQNRYFKKYNIIEDKELAKITEQTLELSILEYDFLDELFRFSVKYPGVEMYHRKSIKNFDLLEYNIFLKPKFIKNKIIKRTKLKASSIFDDDTYLEVKENVIRTIKEFNKKLY